MLGRGWRPRHSVLVLSAAILLFAAADDRNRGKSAKFPLFVCTDEFDLSDVHIERELRLSLLPPIDVIVTAYSSTRGQTDSTPFLTASMTQVRPGVIALSRDLIQRYNPNAPFAYGDQVLIEGHGVFTVEDTMNERYSKRADIWFPSTSEAIEFGKQELTLTMVTGETGSSGGGRFSGSSLQAASAPSK